MLVQVSYSIHIYLIIIGVVVGSTYSSAQGLFRGRHTQQHLGITPGRIIWDTRDITWIGYHARKTPCSLCYISSPQSLYLTLCSGKVPHSALEITSANDTTRIRPMKEKCLVSCMPLSLLLSYLFREAPFEYIHYLLALILRQNILQ